MRCVHVVLVKGSMNHYRTQKKELLEKVRTFQSWMGRDKLSWSHRDAVHITKGLLLRYPCSRTCGVHTLYQTRGDSCKEVLHHVICNVVSLERDQPAHRRLARCSQLHRKLLAADHQHGWPRAVPRRVDLARLWRVVISSACDPA